jgi:hypothetical protein
LQNVKTGSGAHPASHSMDTEGISGRGRGVEREQSGREVDHPPPSSAYVKNEWRCTVHLTHLYALIACRKTTLAFLYISDVKNT